MPHSCPSYTHTHTLHCLGRWKTWLSGGSSSSSLREHLLLAPPFTEPLLALETVGSSSPTKCTLNPPEESLSPLKPWGPLFNVTRRGKKRGGGFPLSPAGPFAASFLSPRSPGLIVPRFSSPIASPGWGEGGEGPFLWRLCAGSFFCDQVAE